MNISTLAQGIQSSIIRVMFNKALEYDDVLSFTVGEPDFNTSDNIIEAGYQAMREGKTKYTPNAGILPLREVIAKEIAATRSLDYDPVTQIVVTPGAMGALYMGLRCLVNPGDEVIICAPYWTNYEQQVLLASGVPVFVQGYEENGYAITAEDIAKAVTPKTKVLMLNFPCNPTGAVLGEEELAKIAKLAIEHDFYVLSDEVYHKIVYDGYVHHSIAQQPGMMERSFIIDSFSKTYAMTGWRVGFLAGPPELAAAVTKMQEDVAACVAMPAQYAAIEALTGPQDHLAHMVEQYKARRDYLKSRIDAMPMITCQLPQATFYMYVNIQATGLSSWDFCMRLLEEQHVVVVPGIAFGEHGEGYIRISFASSMEALAAGMDKLETFLSTLS